MRRLRRTLTVCAYLNGAENAAGEQPALNVEQPAKAEAEPTVERLAPEIEQALKHPKVREAGAIQRSQHGSRALHRRSGNSARNHPRYIGGGTLAEVVRRLAGLPPGSLSKAWHGPFNSSVR